MIIFKEIVSKFVMKMDPYFHKLSLMATSWCLI